MCYELCDVIINQYIYGTVGVGVVGDVVVYTLCLMCIQAVLLNGAVCVVTYPIVHTLYKQE